MIKPIYVSKTTEQMQMGSPRGAEWEQTVESGILLDELSGKELYPGVPFAPIVKRSPSGKYSIAREFESCAWRLIEHASGELWPLLSDGNFTWPATGSERLSWNLNLFVDVVSTGSLGARGRFKTLDFFFDPTKPSDNNYIYIDEINVASFSANQSALFQSSRDLGDSNNDVDSAFRYITAGKKWTRTLWTGEWVGLFPKESDQCYVFSQSSFAAQLGERHP